MILFESGSGCLTSASIHAFESGWPWEDCIGGNEAAVAEVATGSGSEWAEGDAAKGRTGWSGRRRS